MDYGLLLVCSPPLLIEQICGEDAGGERVFVDVACVGFERGARAHEVAELDASDDDAVADERDRQPIDGIAGARVDERLAGTRGLGKVPRRESVEKIDPSARGSGRVRAGRVGAEVGVEGFVGGARRATDPRLLR